MTGINLRKNCSRRTLRSMFEAEVNPSGIDKADLVVSIPSYNEADTIAYAALQASEGLIRYFPDLRAVLINCDNNSPDHTKEAFLDTPTKVPKIYISTSPGIRGKGNNLRNLFRKAVELQAKAIVVVDADVQTLTPEWIRHLGEPLFKGFAFVTPLYVQHKYDGLINMRSPTLWSGPFSEEGSVNRLEGILD